MKWFPLIALSLVTSFTFAATVVDPNLKVQTWIRGLDNPTGLAYLNGNGDALITQKNDGKVLFARGKSIVGTALDLPVSNASEEGLLGIALSPTFSVDQHVYLYYTQSDRDGGTPIVNTVKRYTWNGSTLRFNKNIISLPATPGPNHNGGKMAFGPDGKLYVVSGELNRNEQTSNFRNTAVNPIGSILRLNPSGSSVTTNPFYSAANAGTSKKALNNIYAYGIRNSFGMAFDPASGFLWESENGPTQYDEINRILPGFNGGWERIMGPSDRNGGVPGNLVSLGDRANYNDPKLSWATPVAPTAMEFLETGRLGGEYKNDLFVGDVHGGKLFHFDLTASRKSLVLTGGLADGVADNTTDKRFAEQTPILFGSDFGTVTDIQTGPGGMFVLSLSNGALYRITTNIAPQAAPDALTIDALIVPEPTMIAPIGMAAILLLRRVRFSAPVTRFSHT
jgi:glucose/arabinose dehydrogenase